MRVCDTTLVLASLRLRVITDGSMWLWDELVEVDRRFGLPLCILAAVLGHGPELRGVN